MQDGRERARAGGPGRRPHVPLLLRDQPSHPYRVLPILPAPRVDPSASLPVRHRGAGSLLCLREPSRRLTLKSAARRPRKERMSTPDTSRPSGTLEFLCSAPDFIAWLNSPESREKHRDQYNDLEWASQQPKGAPKYKVGDVVEFHAGGYGVIREVAQPHSGWPSSYATKDVEGYPPHAARKFAWHYEGDFKTLVAKSPLHSLPNASGLRSPDRPRAGDKQDRVVGSLNQEAKG